MSTENRTPSSSHKTYVLRPLLDSHYNRPVDRFWPHVDIRGYDECWPWTKPLNRTYPRPQLSYQGRVQHASRAAYELAVAPIPAGWHVHHRCENPLCCNPHHLKAMTKAEHIALHHPHGEHCPKCGGDRVWKIKPCGHKQRICPPCERKRSAEKYQRQRERAKANAA